MYLYGDDFKFGCKNFTVTKTNSTEMKCIRHPCGWCMASVNLRVCQKILRTPSVLPVYQWILSYSLETVKFLVSISRWSTAITTNYSGYRIVAILIREHLKLTLLIKGAAILIVLILLKSQRLLVCNNYLLN